MKYCTKCAAQLPDEAVFCTGCGASTNTQPEEQAKESTLKTVAKIFMLISTILMGLWLIPLAWCIPMTVSYWKKIKSGAPIGVGFKICSLLFVSTIAGVIMLCDNEK